jgi:hypothetical protein
MANQAIALQARAPQGNFLAPAIQQGAQFINMMRQQQALDRQTAAQEQSMQLARAAEDRAVAGEARATELQPFKVDEAKLKSAADAIKVGMDFNAFINTAAANANSPDQFRAFAERIASVPQFQTDMFKGALSEVVASMPNDPAQFPEWKRQTGIKTIEADKRYKKEIIKQETADGTRQIAVDQYGDGGATVVPGSEVNLGQEVTYITLADGRRVAMPKRLPAGGGGIVGGVRGGGATGGVQIGQPIAGSGKPPPAAKPKSGEISPENKRARDTAVQDLYNAIEEAQAKGHLVSEKQSFIANRAQELRQGRAYLPGGTEQKTSVDNINSAATQLLRMFIQKGTSGTLNTKAEQDMFLSSVGGANSTYETRLKTIRNFAKQNGIKLNETAAAGATSAAPIGPPPPGVPAAEWKAMSPEDRKLWPQ